MAEQVVHSLEEWFTYLGTTGIIPESFFEQDQWEGHLHQGPMAGSLMTSIKAHDGIGTTGLYQKLYGTDAVVNVIYSEETFGLQNKIPYLRSGHRVLTTAAATTGGGVALGGAVSAGDQRTYTTLYTVPALHSKTQDIDLSYKFLEGKDEQVSSDQLVRDMMAEWKDLIDRALLGDYETAAGNNIESMDRCHASSVERAACGETDGDEDFMSKDRSTDTWFNPYVKHFGVGGTETDHDFRLSFLEVALQNVEPYASGPNGQMAYYWQTGFDTYWRVAQAVGPAFKRDVAKMSIGINGVQTDPGSEYSIRVAKVQDHPIFKTNHVKQDTISRIYGVNTDFEGIKILTPPMVVSTDDILKTANFFARTTAAEWSELFTVKSKALAKIRGLQ